MSDKPKGFRLGVGPDSVVIEQAAMTQPLGINGETIKALEQANAFVNQHTTATEALALLPQVEALRLPAQLELLDKLRLPASLELLDKFTREIEERDRLLSRPLQSHFVPVPPPPYDPWPLLKRRRVELAEEEERARLRVRDEWEASKGQAQPPSAAPTPAAPKPKRRILKRKALIAELERDWCTIEADLNEASRNGLSKAARTADGWDVEHAKEWADRKGKLRKAETGQPLHSNWTGLSKVHRVK